MTWVSPRDIGRLITPEMATEATHGHCLKGSFYTAKTRLYWQLPDKHIEDFIRAGSTDSALRALAQGPPHLGAPTKRKKRRKEK